MAAIPARANRAAHMGVTAGLRAYRADAAFDGERRLPGGALVLVRDGLIAGVEPGGAPAPDGCDVTYLPGTTLLPGLIDVHAHLCLDSTADALARLPGLDAGELDRTVQSALAAQLASGVTTVRDLGDHHWSVVDRRGRWATGPTVVAAGPPVTSPGGHCAAMGGEAAGEAGLRAAVRERVARGADLVKVMASGGAMTPGTDMSAAQFSAAELRALVDEAHRHGLPVVAHAHALAAVVRCLDAGVDGIEHCSCLTAAGRHVPPGLLERLARSRVPVDPTLGRLPGHAPAEHTALGRAERLAHARDLVGAGVTVVSGGDSGIGEHKPHGILPHAVIELSSCGAGPLAALASATGRAAQACGIGARTGRVRAGLAADLLLVGGDATTDIAAILDVRRVVVRGQEHL